MNTAVYYIWNLLIELTPKSFHHNEVFSVILKLSEIIMDVY